MWCGESRDNPAAAPRQPRDTSQAPSQHLARRHNTNTWQAPLPRSTGRKRPSQKEPLAVPPTALLDGSVTNTVSRPPLRTTSPRSAAVLAGRTISRPKSADLSDRATQKERITCCTPPKPNPVPRESARLKEACTGELRKQLQRVPTSLTEESTAEAKEFLPWPPSSKGIPS